MLVAQYGLAFIDRIELEAITSPAFREPLGHLDSDPVFRIPERFWERLTTAAGKPIGPMPPHMAALYEQLPDLAETMAADVDPLDSQDVAPLDADALRTQAEGVGRVPRVLPGLGRAAPNSE